LTFCRSNRRMLLSTYRASGPICQPVERLLDRAHT
jgi:hypothetical protein